MSQAIPICLVTGFLGSGKTTLLERIISDLSGQRIVYLVNELSEFDVDGKRLALGEDQLVTVAGGSIFCRCKVTEFVRELERLASLEPSGIVVEASGIADPTVMPRMLAEAGLSRCCRLARLVAVVDPGSFYKLLETLPAIRAQVRAADHVIVNKIDVYDEARILETERAIRELNQGVRIDRASYCSVQSDWLGQSTGRAIGGAYAPCRDPRYETVTVTQDHPVDWRRLRAELDGLGAALYRAKGTVLTLEGVLEVDRSASGWSERPSRAPLDSAAIVVIGSSAAGALAQTLADRIRAGEFSAGHPLG
jgi:G3E family GTPase